MNERLQQQFQFLIEIDKLKQIERQTRLLCDSNRRENDAEHSWHLAMYVMILHEYADEPNIDWLKVLKLVLIHDLVEIYAGDTFIYDTEGHLDKRERELDAANKLFALLPKDQFKEIYSLWDEFENKVTPEARFANVVDRLQPFMHNYFSDGGTWHRKGVNQSKTTKLMTAVTEHSKILGEFVKEAIQQAVQDGKLLNE